MNGTLINRQRGWAMYPWLDCFDSNHSDTFPGRTNFLLPTSCPPARRRIPIAHWSPHPPSLPLFQLFTRVEIRRRGRAFRFESWQDFVNELWTIFHLIQENTISKTIHLFLLLNHLKRLHGSDLLANNSLARPPLFARFKIVSLTCARWYKPLCFILFPHPLRNHFVVLRVCTTTTTPPFLYSQSLQARRSFFATLHPPLRAPFPPSFTSLFRHYEQFVVCPPLPSPTPPSQLYFALVCRLLLPRRTLPFISVHGLSSTRDSL